MKKEFDLEFCYKGSREYVHGTDIFTKLTERYGKNIEKIDIAFHDITVSNMTFFTEKPDGKDVKITFRCLDNENKIQLFGIANNQSIHCRYNYFEEKIVDNSVVDIQEQSVVLTSATEYTFIEHIVAMNKVLLDKLHPNIDGKWYFTRLQLKENISMSNTSSLKIVMQSNFQFKLTKSAIIVNGAELGSIYFSLIPKEL